MFRLRYTKIVQVIHNSFRNLRTDRVRISVTITNAVPATTTSRNPAETMSVNYRRSTRYVFSVYSCIWCKLNYKKNCCVTRVVLYLVITLSDFAFQIPLLFLTNIHAVIICLDYLLQLIYKSETEPAISKIMLQYTKYDRKNFSRVPFWVYS